MLQLCSFLLALSIGQTAPAADTPGRISGRITVEGTNTPLTGVRVILLPGGPRVGVMGPMGPPPQAITNQDGRYTFERVAPAWYRILAEKTGYASTTEQPASQAIQVAAGQAVNGVDLRLQKGAVIAGRVVDAAGEPMPDVHVTAMRRVSPQGMPARLIPAASGPGQQTNDLGEFRISGLPPGEFIVAATPRPMRMFGGPGVDMTTAGAQPVGRARTTTATTFYPGTSDQAAAVPIAVAAGAEVANINFAMQTVPSFRVSGIVVDQDGKPVGGAMVMLMGDPRNGMMFMGPGGSTRTQDSGRFELEDVVAGSYHVNASIPVMMGGPGGRGGAVGAVGAVSNGSFVSINSTGGFTSATWTSSTGGGDSTDPAIEVTVADTDVKDVRVIVRRQTP